MKKLLSVLLLLFALLPVGAHENHGEAEKKPVAHNDTYFSAEAVSDKYELLLKYQPVHPKKESEFTLYLSDFFSNKAIDSAELKITSPDDPSLQFEVHRDEAGIYGVHATFPEKKTYRLNVSIASRNGADLIALSGVEVGKEFPVEAEEQDDSWTSNSWLIFAGGLLGGLLLMFLVMKASRRTKANTLLFIFTCGLIPVQPTAHAHGDEVHTAGSGGGASNTVVVPKETQFLFDIFTRQLQTGDFTESVSLFGTVIPSSNGQAIVQAVQSGKLHSLNVAVGQKVTKGQLLGVLDPALDAASLVNFAAERNTVNAEFEAAKKEYERMQSLSDIAAQKDVEAAKARYETARTNKQLFDNLASGTTDPARLIYLRSPISGVVENFTLTIGSTVGAGDVLFTVTDLSKVYVEAQVFDADADRVAAGGKFTVECTDDNHKTAEVRLVSMAQSINPTNQSQRVLFEMDNPDGEFKIGEFVNVRVFAKEASRNLVVPNSAINEVNGKPVVFIKDAAEHYTMSYVQLGNDNGESTVILKGAEEGERIVVNGSYQLKMIYLNQ